MPAGRRREWPCAHCRTSDYSDLGQGRFALYFRPTTSDLLTRRWVPGDSCTRTTYRLCWNGDGSELSFGRCSFSEELQSGFAIIKIMPRETGRRGDVCSSRSFLLHWLEWRCM